MTEPRTATGKAQLAEMWPDDAPMDSLRVAYAQTLAAIEAEAAALEREWLRALAPDRLKVAWALMPEPVEIVSWASSGTGDEEPPHDARREWVRPLEQIIDAFVAALFADEPTP